MIFFLACTQPLTFYLQDNLELVLYVVLRDGRVIVSTFTDGDAIHRRPLSYEDVPNVCEGYFFAVVFLFFIPCCSSSKSRKLCASPPPCMHWPCGSSSANPLIEIVCRPRQRNYRPRTGFHS